jgi:hypothetical protein
MIEPRPVDRRCRAPPRPNIRRRSGNRGGDDLHQFFDRDLGVLDIGFAGVDHLAEIMRRDVGRHADRDAAGAVDEHVGEAGREHLRLAARSVIVRGEIDSVLVEILEQGHRDLGSRASVYRIEAGGSGSIEPKLPWPSISGRASTSPAACGPARRRSRSRRADGNCPSRRRRSSRICDKGGRGRSRLPARRTGCADARVSGRRGHRERAGDDDRHRIVEIARLHLVDDRDRRNIGVFEGRRGAGQVLLFRICQSCRACG